MRFHWDHNKPPKSSGSSGVLCAVLCFYNGNTDFALYAAGIQSPLLLVVINPPVRRADGSVNVYFKAAIAASIIAIFSRSLAA